VPQMRHEPRGDRVRSIKVDRCSACEGVWLDKGELKAVADLDKLLLEKLYSSSARMPKKSRMTGIWLAFLGFILILLFLDLGVFHRKAGP